MNTQAVQPVIEVLHDKPSALSYSFAGFVGVVSAMSWEAWGVIASVIGIAITTGTNFYFKRKEDKRQERESAAAIRADQAKAESFGRRKTDAQPDQRRET